MPMSMTKAIILDTIKVKTITKIKADTITRIKAGAITTNIVICNAIGVITISIALGCGYAVSC